MQNKPIKSLGQHFLKDKNIAEKIVNSLKTEINHNVVEIGPGRGVLTDYLIKKYSKNLSLIEIDKYLISDLENKFSDIKNNIYNIDFLKFNFSEYFKSQTSIIGNFPYNISNSIFFKILENKTLIPEVVCMIQKEVAERISAKHGNKTYGILSVLLQTFYNIEYLFTVNEKVFDPPPKVKSAVIRLVRKDNFVLECNELDFINVVKTSFNQRRKMLRNSLRILMEGKNMDNEIFTKRPEQLSISEFVDLTNIVF